MSKQDQPAAAAGGMEMPRWLDALGGFIDRTNSVVVTQPTKGSYKAFSSVCPHQGCQVGQVTEEAIVCTCHGSRFDPKTGDVTAGPAEKGLPAKQVAVQGAKLHVTG